MSIATRQPSQRRAPGPPGNFIFGNLPDLRRDPLHFYPEMCARYGDVVRFRGLGSFVWFLISHPDDIERVLKSKQYPKGMFIQNIKMLVGNGLVTSEGDFWRKQRRLAQPAFHRQRLESLATMMTGAAETLAEQWQPRVAHGQPLDVANEMMRLTLQIVGRALFSVDISGAADKVGAAVTVALDHINYRSLQPLALPERIPTPHNRRFLRARQTIDTLVDGIIAERRRSAAHGPDDRGDLLSMLLAARDEETGVSMSSEQLRDEVKTIILAGHETTAVTLPWAWYLLAHHPEIEQHLHDELAGVLGGRTPGLDDLPRLPYTRMVVDEVLRLYPPAWAVARQTMVDDHIQGYHIPAKSPVVMSQYVTHRHPEFWDKPNAFVPERFGNGAEQRPRFAYFPFGGGPRICIGNSFALMEAQLLLATLAQRYDFRLVPQHPVVPEPTVTLRPKYGIRMMLRPRQAA